ncbi:hypothetical protein BDR04DRAFT_1103716, partial [Suillus decipiens]
VHCVEHNIQSQGTSRCAPFVIAWEVLPMVHAATCMKQKRCEEDWKQLWWNGLKHQQCTCVPS